MTRTDRHVIVAADGGGTGCRAAAGTLEAGILGEGRGGPGNVQSDFHGSIANLTGAVASALQAAGLADTPPEQITAHFGVAGAHTGDEMNNVAAALPYGAASVTGDRATSVRGALGEADGYVVALGTGTIIARQQALQMTTVCGWGYDLSDQASGAWLGKRLLTEAVLADEGLRPHTPLSRGALAGLDGLVGAVHFSGSARPADMAALARDVITAAREGDMLGQELMAEGAAFLVRCLDHLGFAEGDLLTLAGGVGPHYAAHLPDRFTRNLAEPKGTALEGAFAMACAAARERLG